MSRRSFLWQLVTVPLFGLTDRASQVVAHRNLKIMMKSAWGADDPTRASFIFAHRLALMHAGHEVQIFLLHLTLIPFLLLTLASILWAQAEPQMPKPGPEYQRLHYYVGNWQTEWETLPGPMTGAGGKVIVTTHSEMLGDFFLVSHREGRGPKGTGKEIGIMGYDPEQKVYTYENFDNDGDVGRATATVSGDTWVLLAPATEACRPAGDKFKERFTLKEVSPTSYTFIGEISTDGGPWTKIEQGKATKK